LNILEKKNTKIQEETKKMLYNRIITNIEHFIKKIQEKIEQCYAVEIMTNIEQKLKIKSGSNKS
jgi:hypothetical protein